MTTDDDPLVLFDHEDLPENLVIEPPESMRDDLLEDFAAKTEELWRDAESGAAQLLGRSGNGSSLVGEEPEASGTATPSGRAPTTVY